tara:strand:- start:416 stop:1147 length:732 start_codon:yes stop_codon:yes gene_type:complete
MMAPAILGLNRKSLPVIAVFFVLSVFWFMQTQYIRFLAPAFAFLSVLLVIGLARLFQKNQIGKTGKLLLTSILAIGLLYNISIIMKKWSHVDPLSYLLKKETRDQFLARQISAYPSYLKTNKMLTEKDKVMLVYMGNLGYLMDRPFFSDTFFEAHTLAQIIDQGVYAADILNRLKARGITHVLFNYNNVFGKDSVLTKGERAIFKNLLIQNGEKLYSKNGFLLYRFMLDSENEKLSIPLNHGL